MRNEFVTTLDKFLSGSTSLGELQEWLLGNLQAILDSNDLVAIEAANRIDADLIGISEGLVDESGLIETLHTSRDQLQTIAVTFFENQSATIAGCITEAADTRSVAFKARSGQEDFRFRRVLV